MDISTQREVLNNLKELEFKYLIVSDDCRFLDTVMIPSAVRQKFISCMNKILGIEFGHSSAILMGQWSKQMMTY